MSQNNKIRFLWIFLLPSFLFADAFYTVNNSDASVSVIDVSTLEVTATISVGPSPFLGAVTPNQKFVYIPCGNTTEVDIIDTSTNTVVGAVTVGTSPQGLAITPNGQFVYVANTVSDDVSVIATATNDVIATIPMVEVSDQPSGITQAFVLPDGAFVYIPKESQAEVVVISTSTNMAVATIRVGSSPVDIAVTPNSARVYVVNNNSSSVSVINVATQAVMATIITETNPTAAQVTADGSLVYVAAGLHLYAISTSTNNIVATIALQSAIQDLAIANEGSGAFVYACSPPPMPGRVYVVDVATNTLVATVMVGYSPGPDVVSADNKYVFVTSSPDNTEYVIETATQTSIASIGVGDNPIGGIYVVLSTPPPTPSSSTVTGKQNFAKFLAQTDFVNIIDWTPPSDFTPVSYQIFRNEALTDLAGTVSASTLSFEDHNRKKKEIYTYYIIAVDDSGATLAVGTVTVFPIS